MEINELVSLGIKAFRKNIDRDIGLDAGVEKLQAATIISALSELGGDSGFSIADVVYKMMQDGPTDEKAKILSSWIGDEHKLPITSQQLVEVFGSGNLDNFAAKLGVGLDEAVAGLQDALPRIIENAGAKNGLLNAIGGIDGAVELARKHISR